MRILIALLIALAAATAGAATFTIPAEVTVKGDALTLADLLPGAPEGWSRVSLGAAPRPGRVSTLQGSWIRSRATEALGGDKLEVPVTVLVNRPGRILTRQEVESAVLDAVLERYGSDQGISFEAVGLPPALGEGELLLEVRLPRGALPERSTIWVDVLVDGSQAGRAYARTSSAKTGEVSVVLARNVRKGEVLTAADLDLQHVRGRPGAFGSVEEVAGKVLSRSLPKGTVLTGDNVASKVLIEKNSLVRLVARMGAVVASTSGKALSNGALGEVMLVENLSSGHVVQGVVKQAGVVEALTGSREVN